MYCFFSSSSSSNGRSSSGRVFRAASNGKSDGKGFSSAGKDHHWLRQRVGCFYPCTTAIFTADAPLLQLVIGDCDYSFNWESCKADGNKIPLALRCRSTPALQVAVLGSSHGVMKQRVGCSRHRRPDAARYHNNPTVNHYTHTLLPCG